MKRRLLYPFLATLAVLLAIGPIALAHGGTIAPCERSDHAVTEAQCDLKGPVRTAETWLVLPNRSSPNVTSSYTFLAFDANGRLTARRIKTDTGLRSSTIFNFSSDGRTLTISDDWSRPPDSDEHRPTTVITFDAGGHEIRSELTSDGGNVYTTEDVYDNSGRLLWETSYSDARYRESNRIYYKYDSQGKLIEEAARSWRVDYEYPAAKVVRRLYFGGDFIPRNPEAPDSVPTTVVETTNDGHGRPVKIVTTMPGAGNFACDCTMPGTITIRYDTQGRVLDRTERSPAGSLKTQDLYVYDANGNILSAASRMQNGENVSKCSYIYDQRGNWIWKETYSDNPNGVRTIWTVESRNVTYYQ
ncbi:MAG TPA: hypothetical protein VMF66_10060 [Candidatus Acidoferrum sp.]|nr:hypothetical protein [Candidatus Acidoferrum sp.]